MNKRIFVAEISAVAVAFIAFAWLALAAEPSTLQTLPFQPTPGIVPVDCAGDCVESCQDANPNNEGGYSKCLTKCLEGCNLPDVPDVPPPSPGSAFNQTILPMDCAGDCVESCQDANPNNEGGYSKCLTKCLEGCNLPDVPDVPPPSPGMHLSSDLHFQCIDDCKSSCRIDNPNEDSDYWACVSSCAANCPPPESDPKPQPAPGDTAEGKSTRRFDLVPMDCGSDCVESCQAANPNNNDAYESCLSACLDGCIKDDPPDVPDVPDPTPVPEPGSTADGNTTGKSVQAPSRLEEPPPPPFFLPPPSEPAPGDTADNDNDDDDGGSGDDGDEGGSSG